jgi:hypothetical protein
LDTSLVQTLGLPVDGITLANLPAGGGWTPAAKHDAAVTILHSSGDPHLNLVVTDLIVVELSLSTLGYEVLIGRDVLARCRFLYNGPRGWYRLAY